MTRTATIMTTTTCPTTMPAHRAGPARRRPGVRLGLAAAAAAGCVAGLLATTVTASGASGQTITLYSGQHQQTTQSLITAFEQKTGITVNVRYDDEDTFVAQIETEGKHSPADVFLTENSPPLEELASKGLLSSIEPSTLAQTPAKYNAPDGDWVGISARVSVMVYNTSLLKASQLPTSAMDLAQPKWKGKIALAGAETDFQPIVTSVARAYGNAKATTWLDGIKANSGSHVYPDNETIADEVNRGAVAFGVVNQYYWYRMKAELGASNVQSKIAYFAPHDPGYVVDVSGAAILKSSKNVADAQKFLAFVVSKQGQQIIAHSISYEYPLDDGVTTSAPETPFADLRPYPISIADLGDGSTAISLLRQAGLL